MMNNPTESDTIVFEALNCSLNRGLWFTAHGIADMTGLHVLDVRSSLGDLASAGLVISRTVAGGSREFRAAD